MEPNGAFSEGAHGVIHDGREVRGEERSPAAIRGSNSRDPDASDAGRTIDVEQNGHAPARGAEHDALGVVRARDAVVAAPEVVPCEWLLTRWRFWMEWLVW